MVVANMSTSMKNGGYGMDFIAPQTPKEKPIMKTV
jgi:hypothetical protein